MHPRVSLHQVGALERSTAAFLDLCHGLGIANAVLVADKLRAEGGEAIRAGGAAEGPRIAGLTQTFCRDLSQAGESEVAATLANIALAEAVGAPCLYMLTGGRGALDWAEAAGRFAALIAPCRDEARARGVALLIENASALYADLHIAHTFADTVALASSAGIGVCAELFHCWAESAIDDQLRHAVPLIGLVQVSDYVLGDRALPARAVPGDGAIPLERVLGALLDAGYSGVFDLELIGPRIDAEGIEAAARRGAERVAAMLARLEA